MTRIVLLLTAIPLAAVLALILNTLLDRRLAAITAPTRRTPTVAPRRSRAVWTALALLYPTATAPALARASDEAVGSVCASIECSLMVESALVDRLWEPAPDSGIVLVAQSRIPVWLDADSDADRGDADSSEKAEDESQPPLATASAPTAAGSLR